MIILALQIDSHETGIALANEEGVIYASNEERFTRVKMDKASPVKSLSDGLRFTGIKPEEIDYIVISGFRPFKQFRYYGKLFRDVLKFAKWKYLLGRKDIISLILKLVNTTGILLYLNRVRNLRKIKKLLKGFKGETLYVDHHLAHSASAYYGSGWDECLIMVAEGGGWDYTTSLAIGSRGRINYISRTPWPHSPGVYYRLITRVAGFNYRRHAGKITGLAAYGNPDKAYHLVKELLMLDEEGMELRVSPLVFTLQEAYINKRRLPDYFEDHSKEDLSAAFQKRLEECLCELVLNGVRKTGLRKVVLAGGVVANVRLNRRILDLDVVDGVYVHPGMGDEGQAVGCALYFLNNSKYVSKSHNYVPKRFETCFLGPEYSNERVKTVLDSMSMIYHYEDRIERKIAELLNKNKVVARFNGRMEYGPRALGNRSILYSPKDVTINDWLNKRLKRSEFMPFAPTVLYEFREKCFKKIKENSFSAEFMTITYECSQWMKENCPAVIHIDGTARPQLLRKEANPSYYTIIEEFYKLTGLPCILNTSFNMHEEPIVCTPEDAISAFLRGHLDVLAINNFLVLIEENMKLVSVYENVRRPEKKGMVAKFIDFLSQEGLF